MPILLAKISIRNMSGLPTRFQVLEPPVPSPFPSSIDLPANSRGEITLNQRDVQSIRVAADDGSHQEKQTFSVLTSEMGEQYYIFSADIGYRIGSFIGGVQAKTDGWEWPSEKRT
jgi:hypothetical protein